jgi:hypothetical protein
MAQAPTEHDQTTAAVTATTATTATTIADRPLFGLRSSLWVFVAILLVYCVVAIVAVVLLSGSTPADRPPTATADLTEQVNREYAEYEARDCFSADRLNDPSVNPTVYRRREVQKNLLGPLVPVDCQKNVRYCLRADNCKMFCKDAAVVPFDCTNGVCVQRPVDNEKPTGGDNESHCDTKNGEYGLLVGYNELGIAQWECVQMYTMWTKNRKSYCQNGVLNIDARKREPSYRDCICPEGSVRIVYRKSVLGQTVCGLPYCVPENLYKFYELSYQRI